MLRNIPRDKDGHIYITDVLKALEEECLRTESLTDTISRYNHQVFNVIEKKPCKPKSHRSPAAVKRSIKAALAR